HEFRTIFARCEFQEVRDFRDFQKKSRPIKTKLAPKPHPFTPSPAHPFILPLAQLAKLETCPKFARKAHLRISGKPVVSCPSPGSCIDRQTRPTGTSADGTRRVPATYENRTRALPAKFRKMRGLSLGVHRSPTHSAFRI